MADNKEDRYGLMTFTGPAGRTYYDKDGKLQTAAENEIREEYDPLTGAYLGMLIEQSGTNLAPNSLDSSKNIDNGSATFSSDKIVATFSDNGNDFTGRYQLGGLPDGIYVASIFARKSNAENPATQFRLTVNNTRSWNTGTQSEKITLTNQWQRVSAYLTPSGTGVNAYIGNALKNGSRDSDCSGAVDVKGLQIETGTVASSYIPTNGSPVTRAREDARFTDPSVFNNFERGAFVVDFKPIRTGNAGRILATTPTNSFASLSGNGQIYGFSPGMQSGDVEKQETNFERSTWAISWDNGSTSRLECLNGDVPRKVKHTGFESGVVQITLDGIATYAKDIQVYPEPLSDDEMRRLTTRDATTVIGDCPDGGYYDYSDLSTMLVQSDESGIAIEDRMIARVGDPVGAILDKSGHGNHMTASTDDRRGILRSDGELYWIEKKMGQIYGFNWLPERTVTAFVGIKKRSRLIVLSDSEGGQGAYAMFAFEGSGAAKTTGGWPINYLKNYVNGKNKPVTTRDDNYQALEPVSLWRGLFTVDGPVKERAFLYGFPDFSQGYDGPDYGFAWATRLSEDDAEIVERDMRKNMPAVQ